MDEYDRYMLKTDDDGHWFVVPVVHEDAFMEYVENPDDLSLPNGVIEVGGSPSLVTFSNPIVD